MDLHNIQNAFVMPGRLIVRAIESDSVDEGLGIRIGIDPSKTKFATICRSADEDNYPVGATVMYERIHSSDITMEDTDGNAVEYLVIMTADVSLMFKE